MPEASATKQSLDDLMVAMDVVDTLRHRQILIDRELDAEGRRDRLVDRLRSIYQEQGIEVTDEVLERGVSALEDDRFRYAAPGKGFTTWLARQYVRRLRGFRPFLIFVLIIVGIKGCDYFTETLPERRLLAELPQQISQTYRKIQLIAGQDEIIAQAQAMSARARDAVDDEDADTAQRYFDELRSFHQQLRQSYRIRITSRPGELSGVWRLPDTNSSARNYYLIVEAVNDSGKRLTLPVSNEENNQVQKVDTWGLRVDKATFQRIADDKKDDGIIQGNSIGRKRAGELNPEYDIPTSGATITRW